VLLSKSIKRIAADKRALVIVALCVLNLCIYWQAISCDFVTIDDPGYITGNIRVLQGLSVGNIRWAFTTFEMFNWHPLTWLSHMTDVQLFGLSHSGHHFISILLHAMNAALLFLLLLRATRNMLRSALVSVLFSIHPLHIESVVWLSERKDLLSGLFFFITLYCYVRYVEKPCLKRYVYTIFAFACGLMSKPMIVTLPFMLLLFDYWPLKRYPSLLVPTRNVLIEKIPLLFLSGISSFITILAQKAGGALVPLEELSFTTRLVNAIMAYTDYLLKTIWPTHLSVLYPMVFQVPSWKIISATIVLFGITFCTLKFRSRLPYCTVGWFWFLGMLFPVIGLVQVGGQAMADRYTYLPHVGLFIAIVWFLSEIRERYRQVSTILVGLAIASIVILTTITLRQIPHWENGITLFRQAIASTENNALAHYHLGVALGERGLYEDAAREYSSSIILIPKFAAAHFALGYTYMQMGLIDRAVSSYEEALSKEPHNLQFLTNLGLALVEQGRLDQALMRYLMFDKAYPNNDTLHVNWGGLLQKAGYVAEAQAHFLEALRINPNNKDASYYLMKGR
jgi:protein O-mannosyl-transferase